MPLLADGQSTLLELTGIGVPPWSARGLSQTLLPIDQAGANIKRTWNGVLKDLSLTRFQKYASTITGEDVDPPACDGKWPGQLVTVKCIARLSYLTAGGAPARTVVTGSSYVEGSYTIYRPQLSMMVVAMRPTEEDEWGAVVSWELDLEEV